MKIRMSFVSNSSSSSFLIYGVCTEDKPSVENLLKVLDMEAAKKKWVNWYAKKQQEYGESHSNRYPDTTWEEWLVKIEDDITWMIEDRLPLFFDDFPNLSIHWPFDNYYIGLDPRNMDDDETMGEFKIRAEKAIQSMVNEDTKLDWHELAWRDG